MATKLNAIKQAKESRQLYPSVKYFIYRVGSQWMYTSRPREQVQAEYKVQLKEWQEI